MLSVAIQVWLLQMLITLLHAPPAIRASAKASAESAAFIAQRPLSIGGVHAEFSMGPLGGSCQANIWPG
jgi:hypothetical protein